MARKISLVYTLAFLAAFCTILITPVGASSNNIGVHARMIKKRVAAADDPIRPNANGDLPLIGVGDDPNDPSNPNNQGTATGASASATNTQSGAAASATKSAAPSASGNPLIPPISLPSLGGNPAPTVSSANSSLSSTSSLPSSTSASSSSTTPSSTQTPSSTSDNTVTSTQFATPSDQNAASSPTGSTDTSGATSGSGSHLTRNTIIAIVVVAACVGGAIVIWTVIRKWKFAPSDEFGDRLNPIDWRPTSASEKEKDADVTGAAHRRNGSRGSNRSFVSADAHGNNSNNNYGNGNMISDLPAHDFTAGAAVGHGGLAPVGAYADLRRGPSPTPSMGEQYYRGYGATQYGRNGY